MKHDPGLATDRESWPDPAAPGVIRLRQAVRAGFRAVVGEASVILRVEQGHKRLRGAMVADVAEGALTLMPAGLALDVENHPGAAGLYRATGILLHPALTVPRGTATATQCTDPRAHQAFEQALARLRTPSVPQALRDHAVQEVVLWLDAAGVRLPQAGPPTLPDRVRRITLAALDRDWTATEIAAALAMSVPTLRRKLAAEGTGLAMILTDQRMTRALALLQTSDLPVGVIAADVGYASASRFAARFRARFGVTPGTIRGRFDHPGRKVDRPGTETGPVGG